MLLGGQLQDDVDAVLQTKAPAGSCGALNTPNTPDASMR